MAQAADEPAPDSEDGLLGPFRPLKDRALDKANGSSNWGDDIICRKLAPNHLSFLRKLCTGLRVHIPLEDGRVVKAKQLSGQKAPSLSS